MGEMNLPWSIYLDFNNPDCWPGIEAAEGESVVIWGSPSNHDDEAGIRARTVKEARKRAALIVRAVNRDALFDEMVEALEPLGKLANEVFVGSLYVTKADDAPLLGFNNFNITYGHLRRARAVLSKVREASK